MLQEMMNECCGKEGQPEIGKMKEFMEHHDQGAKLDTIGWSIFFIWIGVAWLADVGLGVGLLGIAAIILGVQLARYIEKLKVEMFWIVAGLAFGIGGLWEFFIIQTPVAPLVLILIGIGLLAWQFAPRKKHS